MTTSTAIVPASSTPSRGKRFGFGAIFGGILGALVGGPAGAVAGAALGGGIGAATGKSGASPASAAFAGAIAANHARVYREAMTTAREPHELRTLADAFDKQGHRSFATMLRRRANLRDLPAEQKKARRDAFRAAMSSDDPGKIFQLASSFEGEAATGAANELYDHARAVRAATMAGARARPLGDMRTVEQLGDRLGKAIIHYGPESLQAKTAAANFLRARGVQPSDDAIRDVISVAHGEIASQQAEAQAARAQRAVSPDAAPSSAVGAPNVSEDEGPIIDVPGTQSSVEHVESSKPPPAEGSA